MECAEWQTDAFLCTQKQYPLADYVEVIESEMKQTELFDAVCSYFVDTYSESTKDYSWRNDSINTEVISFRATKRNIDPKNKNRWLEYDVALEFKDKRFRLGIRNVEVKFQNIDWEVQTHTTYMAHKNLDLRKVGYEAYKKTIETLSADLHKVANGTYGSW